MRHSALIGLLMAAARANLPPPDFSNRVNGWQRPLSTHGGGAGKKRRAEQFARRMGRRMRRGR